MDNFDLLSKILASKAEEPMPGHQSPPIYSVYCSDSRMGHRAFVQNPDNYLFATRNIGNRVTHTMGSAAYPIGHLGSVKLVLIAGHVGCGAVNAAVKMSADLQMDRAQTIKDAIAATIEQMKVMKVSALHTDAEEAIADELAPVASLFSAASGLFVDEAPYYPKHAELNVHLQVESLMQMHDVRQQVNGGKLVVAGIMHDFLGK